MTGWISCAIHRRQPRSRRSRSWPTESPRQCRKPEGTYLVWLDVRAVAERIGAKDSPPRPTGRSSGSARVTAENMVERFFVKGGGPAERGIQLRPRRSGPHAHEHRDLAQARRAGTQQHGEGARESQDLWRGVVYHGSFQRAGAIAITSGRSRTPARQPLHAPSIDRAPGWSLIGRRGSRRRFRAPIRDRDPSVRNSKRFDVQTGQYSPS